MPTSSKINGPMQDWISVLDAMSECVARTLESGNCPEPQTENANPESGLPPVADFRHRLDATIRGLEQRLDVARTLASRIEGLLDRDEQEVRDWRAKAESARRRLAASGQLS